MHINILLSLSEEEAAAASSKFLLIGTEWEKFLQPYQQYKSKHPLSRTVQALWEIFLEEFFINCTIYTHYISYSAEEYDQQNLLLQLHKNKTVH